MNKSDTVVAKFTSGRFWCIILFAVTMSYLAIVEPTVRDVFFALGGALLRDYFMMKRDDKPKEPNGNPPTTSTSGTTP